MKCMSCGGRMETKRTPHLYDWSGLDNVVLVGVDVSECTQCGEEEVAIPRQAELHRVLARAVTTKQGRLTGAEARFLRKHLGWSGEDFARYMGVDRSTVSRWEHGKRPMPPTAERLLRLYVLHVEPVQEYPLHRLAEVPREDVPPERYRLTSTASGWQTVA